MNICLTGIDFVNNLDVKQNHEAQFQYHAMHDQYNNYDDILH